MRMNRVNFYTYSLIYVRANLAQYRASSWGDFSFFLVHIRSSSSSVTASMRRTSFFSLSRVEQIVPDSRTRSVSNGFLEGWLALFVRRESLPDHSSVFTADCAVTPLEYAPPRLCSLWSALCTRLPNKTIERCMGEISGGYRIDQVWHIEIIRCFHNPLEKGHIYRKKLYSFRWNSVVFLPDFLSLFTNSFNLISRLENMTQLNANWK